MKISALLVTVIASSLAVVPVVSTDNQYSTLEASVNDLTFVFYSRNLSNGTGLHLSQFSDKNTLTQVFNPKLKTVVLVHGWKDDYSANSNTRVRDAIFQKYNVNIIKVDWSPLADFYLTAKNSVSRVGQFSAQALAILKVQFGYSYDNITLIGFSLGAHVVGCIGANLNGEIPLIIGLDPAGVFISAKDDFALSKADAKYVQVIHTSTTLGLKDAIGHSDFYPNGGSSQAGCIEIAGTCSHNRAWAYLVESILDNKFVATQCTSYRNYTRGRCSGGSTALMGGLTPDTSILGTFYLSTNKASPFGQGA